MNIIILFLFIIVILFLSVCNKEITKGGAVAAPVPNDGIYDIKQMFKMARDPDGILDDDTIIDFENMARGMAGEDGYIIPGEEQQEVPYDEEAWGE
jgi:hypothetical protein|uniref:Uncharacterized protein n=1 Tax=viral metagenome TaxID=1070528 RepID=A0A6C0LJL4_9ZZZZ